MQITLFSPVEILFQTVRFASKSQPDQLCVALINSCSKADNETYRLEYIVFLMRDS